MSEKSCYGCKNYAICLVKTVIEEAIHKSYIEIFSKTARNRILVEVARECPYHIYEEGEEEDEDV